MEEKSIGFVIGIMDLHCMNEKGRTLGGERGFVIDFGEVKRSGVEWLVG